MKRFIITWYGGQTQTIKGNDIQDAISSAKINAAGIAQINNFKETNKKENYNVCNK